MNKEIEDALHTLLHCSLEDDRFIYKNADGEWIVTSKKESKRIKEKYLRSAIEKIDLIDEDYPMLAIENKLNEIIKKVNELCQKVY